MKYLANHFYIKEHKQKYNLKEIKQNLNNFKA